MNMRQGIGLLVGLSMLIGFAGCSHGPSDEIVRVSRQNNSGTYAYFREAVLGKKGKYKLGSIDLSGSKDVVEMVAKTPNAIGYSGMGYATPEVKMLKVAPKKGAPSVAPTVEAAKSGEYPLARPLYLYTLGDPEGAVKHYIDWIRSEEGQAVVAQQGYVPVEPIALQESSPPEGEWTIKVGGSDTMVNVAQAWAEEYTKKFSNVDVQVSGGGSGVGIAKLIDGTLDIANSSREMKPEEREKAEANSGKPIREFIVGMDALAIYVHKENPLESISIEELREIYGDGGSITRWSQVDGWPKEASQ